MLLIDGMGLGVNWQRFLSETLNPVVAPPPPPPPPPKQDDPAAGPANPVVAPPIPVNASSFTDPSKPTNAEIADATSLMQRMAAQYTAPPPDITVENKTTQAVRQAIQDAQTKYDDASKSLQGAQNVLHVVNRDPESTPEARQAAQADYAKARTAADTAQRELNVTTDAGYTILYGEQADADKPSGIQIDADGKVTNPGDAQNAANDKLKTLQAAFPDHANDPTWIPKPGDCKTAAQSKLYDEWRSADAHAAAGTAKYFSDLSNAYLARTQLQSYLVDPDYKAALDAGIGRLNDALAEQDLQVNLPEAPDSPDAAQKAVTAAAKAANTTNAALAAANDAIALAQAQQKFDVVAGRQGTVIVAPNSVSDANAALKRAQTAANTSGGYLQMLAAQQQVDQAQADCTAAQQASDKWHRENPRPPHLPPVDAQVDLDLAAAYGKLSNAKQQASIAHDGFVAAYGATLAQQYDDQAAKISAQVKARQPLLKPFFQPPPQSTWNAAQPAPSSSLSTAAGAAPGTSPSLPSAFAAPLPAGQPAASSPPIFPLTAPSRSTLPLPAAPSGPTQLDATRLQVVAGALRMASNRLADDVNSRAAGVALSNAQEDVDHARSALAAKQQQYDAWAAANPPPVRLRTLPDGDVIPAPSYRANPYQSELNDARAAVTKAENAVPQLQLLRDTSRQQVLLDQFDASLDERLRYVDEKSNAADDYKKAMHDFYEAHRTEMSNSMLDAASLSTQNGGTIAFGSLNENQQRNLIGIALGQQPDVPADPSSPALSAADDSTARFVDKDKLSAIDSVRDKLLSVGGGKDTKISVLPMVYAAKETGTMTSALFKVTDQDGKTHYIDESAGNYDSIDDYLDSNQLSSDGTVDILTGHNADGSPQLVQKAAHHDSAADSVLNFFTGTGVNVGMLLGGMALEVIGTALDGTVIGAAIGVPLNILGAGMTYTAIGSAMTKAGLDLANRVEHDQSISPFDAGARADYINLVPMAAGGAAKLAGTKLFERAVTTRVASVVAKGAQRTAFVTGVAGAGEAFVESGVDLLQGNTKAAGEAFESGVINTALMGAGVAKQRAVTGIRTRTGRPIAAHTTDGNVVKVDDRTIGQILNRDGAASLSADRTRATLDGEAVKVAPDGTLMVGDKVLTYEDQPIRVLDKVSARQMPPGKSVVLGQDGTLSVVSASPKAWTHGTRIDSVTDTGERMTFGPDGAIGTTSNIVAKSRLDRLDEVIDQGKDLHRQLRDTAAREARRVQRAAAEGEGANAAHDARSTQRTSEARAQADRQHDDIDADRTTATRGAAARVADIDEPAGAGTRKQPDGTPPRVNVRVVDLTNEAPATRPATSAPAGIAVPRGPGIEPMQVGERTVYLVRNGAHRDPAAPAPRPQDLDEPVIVVAGEHDAALAPELANRWRKPVYAATPDAFGADGQLRADARVLRFDPAPETAAAERGPAAAAAEAAPPASSRPAAPDETVVILAGKRGPNEPAMPRAVATPEPVTAHDGIFSAPNRVLVVVKPDHPAIAEAAGESAADRGSAASTPRDETPAEATGDKTVRTHAGDERPLVTTDDPAPAEAPGTAPPDYAAPHPGWITRMQMRLGGASLPEAVQALALQSGTLATQLRMLQDAGWRVTIGKRGRGSHVDTRKRRVTIDGGLRDAGSITYALARESRKAVEAMAGVLDHDYGPRGGFTRKALEAEARAQISAFEARYEIKLATGIDIAAHLVHPDAIAREGANWRGRSHDYAGTVDRLASTLGSVPTSGADGPTYRAFYNDAWSRQKGRGGMPRRMPAPRMDETAAAPRGVARFDARVAWSRAHAEIASPYRAGERPDAAELAAARTRHFTIDPVRRVVVLHADTRADGTLLVDGQPVGAHEYLLEMAPPFVVQEGYAIVLAARHDGAAHAARLANLWQRPVYAAPAEAVGEHGALLDTGTFQRLDPAPAAPHDLGPLHADPLGVYARGDRNARVDVAREAGELLGAGGEKTVFALGDDAALGLYDRHAQSADGHVRAAVDERLALDDLRSYGLQTVTMSGPFSALGRVGVLYRPLGVLHTHTMVETGTLPRVVTRAALEHIRTIRAVVEREGLAFDLQGIFTRKGDFLLSDPGPVSRDPVEHLSTLDKLAELERLLAHGLEQGDIAVARPLIADTLPPDAFVQKPSVITQIRMWFGGAPLSKEALALVDRSTLLSGQLAHAQAAGWTVVVVRPGRGSRIDTDKQRIVLDGRMRHTGTLVYALAHEAQHAVDAIAGRLLLDGAPGDTLVDRALTAEARAQANAFAVRRELIDDTGIDISKDVRLPDAIAREADRVMPGDEAGLRRLADAFGDAEPSVPGYATYRDYYASRIARMQAGGVPREMAAPAAPAPRPARGLAARRAAKREQRALDLLASHGKRDLLRVDGDQLDSIDAMKAAFGPDAHVLIALRTDRPADRRDAIHPQPEFIASFRTNAQGKFVDKTGASDDVDPHLLQDAFLALKDKGAASRAKYDYYVSPVALAELRKFGGAARIDAYFGERRAWDVEPSDAGVDAQVVDNVHQLDSAPRFYRPKPAARHDPDAGTTVYAVECETGTVLGYATRDAAGKWTYVETTSLGDATIESRELAAAFRRRFRALPGGRRGVKFFVTRVAHDVVESYGGFAPAKMRRPIGKPKAPLSKPDAYVQRWLGSLHPSLRRQNRAAAEADLPDILPTTADSALDFNAHHADELKRALEMGKIPDGHYVYVYDHEGTVTDVLTGSLTGLIAVENGTVRWYDDVGQFRDPDNAGLPLERATIGRGPYGGNQHFLLSRLAPDVFEPRAAALKAAALQAAQPAAAASPPAAPPSGAGPQAGKGGKAGRKGRKGRQAARGTQRTQPAAGAPARAAAAPAAPPPKPIALAPYQPAYVSGSIVEAVTRYGNAKIADFASTLERLTEWGKRDVGRKEGNGLTFTDPPKAILADAVLAKKIFGTLHMWREASSLHPHGAFTRVPARHNLFMRGAQWIGAARSTDRKLIRQYVKLAAHAALTDLSDRFVPMSRSFSLRDDPEQMKRYIKRYGGALPAVALQVDPYSLAAAMGALQDPGFIQRAKRFGDPAGARYDDETATLTRTAADGTQHTLELDDLAHLHKWLTAASEYGFLLRIEAAPSRPRVSLEDGHAMAGTNNGYAEMRRIGEALEQWAEHNGGKPSPLVLLTFHGSDAVLEPVPGEGHAALLDAILSREQLDWVHVGLSWGTHGDDFIANADLTRALAAKIADYRKNAPEKFARLHGGDALTRVFEPVGAQDFANQQRFLFSEIERIAKQAHRMSDAEIAELRDALYEGNTSTLLNLARRATNEASQTHWNDKAPHNRLAERAHEAGRQWLDRYRDSVPERPPLASVSAADSHEYWASVTGRKALQYDASLPIGAARKAIAQPDTPSATMDEASARVNALRVHRLSKDPADLRKAKIAGGIVLGASGAIGLGAWVHRLDTTALGNTSASFLLASRLGRVFQVMHQGAIRSLQSGDPRAAVAALTSLGTTLARQFNSTTHDYGAHRLAQLEAAVRHAQAKATQYVEQYRQGTMSFDDAKTNITALAEDVLTQMQGFVGGTSLQQLHAGNPRSRLGITARAGMTVASVATVASGVLKTFYPTHPLTALDVATGWTAIASGVIGTAYAGTSLLMVSRRVNADKRSRVVRLLDSTGDLASVALGGLSAVSQWRQGDYDLAIATGTMTSLLLAGRLNTHFPNATSFVKKIPTAVVMIPVAAYGYKFAIGIAPVVGGFFNWLFGGGSSQSNVAPGASPNASPSASPSAPPSPSASASPSQPQPSPGMPSNPPSPSNTPQPYIVVDGDSLWVIADQHRQSLLDAAHVSRADQQAMTRGEQDARALKEIVQLNPSVARDPGNLTIGTPLIVG
ncbi:TPA: LWXIA domain-containing protein [Burkholderia cenocepacia]|uniref:LWXIA domain-containing protein n=1 Tax=unclassified Burkholderia TaxID=2613784 RepID=UPI001588FECF|nr:MULTISPECIES: LWXIA domain-containing protein [unclassified Burkholderia]HEF5872748.1 LWXIA domain-containing protein [Burkholderia cenocepacia]